MHTSECVHVCVYTRLCVQELGAHKMDNLYWASLGGECTGT